MGKKSAAVSGKKPAAASASKEANSEPAEELGLGTTLPLMAALCGLAWGVGEFEVMHSAAEGRCNFLVRLLFYILLDGVFARSAANLFVMAARVLARALPGAIVPDSAAACAAEESMQHDPSLAWPLPGTELPPQWVKTVAATNPKRKQPFFLNHVRGSLRLRQAALRLGAAVGTILQVGTMSVLLDQRSLRAIGLPTPLELFAGRDLYLGLLTGATCVLFLFVAEVALGWVKIVGYCETVTPGEWLSLNLLWDTLFHIGVAINEEVSMRGWMLLNVAHALIAHVGVSAESGCGLSVAMQSALFALAHLNSPGATFIGLVNLMIGGVAGALNVFLSGGLGFALGWHFGWNILMGHLLGLSTSGIPMSSKARANKASRPHRVHCTPRAMRARCSPFTMRTCHRLKLRWHK